MIFISIHAPAKGATPSLTAPGLPNKHFNPRSREGSDQSLLCSGRRPEPFQSTLPRRERLKDFVQAISSDGFQSTLPRRERRSNINSLINTLPFQSTLPRRERPYSRSPKRREITISIHAPAKGATSKITYFFSNIDFYLGNTNKLQYCSFHFTILLIIFLLLSMVRTPLPFYVRLPPAPAYIIRIPSAS